MILTIVFARNFILKENYYDFTFKNSAQFFLIVYRIGLLHRFNIEISIKTSKERCFDILIVIRKASLAILNIFAPAFAP
jgi:hypothetical protein